MAAAAHLGVVGGRCAGACTLWRGPSDAVRRSSGSVASRESGDSHRTMQSWRRPAMGAPWMRWAGSAFRLARQDGSASQKAQRAWSGAVDFGARSHLPPQVGSTASRRARPPRAADSSGPQKKTNRQHMGAACCRRACVKRLLSLRHRPPLLSSREVPRHPDRPG